ncbi:hypothetical protein FDUTEX481_00803 [Tolypothrix sp. PCC 7601]|nr:hypothetical protein FDUTEX481_00803 [Tolypothrix sp. PCC 7601]
MDVFRAKIVNNCRDAINRVSREDITFYHSQCPKLLHSKQNSTLSYKVAI